MDQQDVTKDLLYLGFDFLNKGSSLPEVLEETHWGLNSPLPSLMYLSLSNNHLVGNLPEWLSQLNNLVGLSLDYNLFHGPIPASLGNLQNLTGVNLSGNQLNGTLPDSFGQLSQLSALDVFLYNLIGSISEVHFSKLNKLKFLRLSSNSFFSNVSSNWVPPFQVQDLEVGSCHLGPTFPAWLRTQKEVHRLISPMPASLIPYQTGSGIFPPTLSC
ncbi:receptor-like protein EIX2 [Hevea brasiliensis]|uniref:receptor-like protein EIX2 n=1 Tax=Hevea brasiliensis TaxID=3981 RepID=UPI0025E203F4|nr:receptor-like protein EIX2 [Hevea brasiliensis]